MFYQQICKFMKKHKDYLSPPRDIDKSLRDTPSKPTMNEMIEHQVHHVSQFIPRLWDGLQSRLAETDLSPGKTS